MQLTQAPDCFMRDRTIRVQSALLKRCGSYLNGMKVYGFGRYTVAVFFSYLRGQLTPVLQGGAASSVRLMLLGKQTSFWAQACLQRGFSSEKSARIVSSKLFLLQILSFFCSFPNGLYFLCTLFFTVFASSESVKLCIAPRVAACDRMFLLPCCKGRENSCRAYDSVPS